MYSDTKAASDIIAPQGHCILLKSAEAGIGPAFQARISHTHEHYIADGIVTHNCFYGWKLGAGHSFFGPNNATDLGHMKKVNPQNMVHLTEKPVKFAARAIHYSSRPGENVLDIFGGSGSTLIAAEQTDRKAILMTLDCLYADAIVQRWEKFTGRKAERIAQERQHESRKTPRSPVWSLAAAPFAARVRPAIRSSSRRRRR